MGKKNKKPSFDVSWVESFMIYYHGKKELARHRMHLASFCGIEFAAHQNFIKHIKVIDEMGFLTLRGKWLVHVCERRGLKGIESLKNMAKESGLFRDM